MLAEPKWHPILACEEYQPGHWVMIDSLGKPYAFILIVRHGDEVGYRVDSWAQDAADRKLVGYYTNLRGASRAGHQAYLSSFSTPVKHDLTGQPYKYSRGEGKANTPMRVERD